jgi:hypothetical protein
MNLASRAAPASMNALQTLYLKAIQYMSSILSFAQTAELALTLAQLNQ